MQAGMAEEILVDVVAAARRLQTRRRAASKTAVPPPSAGQQACPLGHQQAAGARFCAVCGLPMGAAQPTARVDLDAIREATQGRPMSSEARAAYERQHTEAIAANQRVEQEMLDISQVPDPSEQKILIHFVEDGFTWKKVWLKGEMLELGPDHPWWESAQPWIRLTQVEQYQRYGRVFFGTGPYPGAAHRPGTEVPLAAAPAQLWAEARGAAGLPARPDPEGTGSLIPR